ERGQEDDTVRMWIDGGLYSPPRALDLGLIDGIRYWDQIRDSFEDVSIKLVTSRDYLRSAGPAFSGSTAPKVAVIHAQGTIIMGESGFDVAAGPTMGSETVIRELRRVQRNDRIKAVILRVDSPGGDGLAGEMISREVELTSGKKPIVVSMSDVAASGGYEISYRADRIVAMPGSITGSIGSITGKLNLHGFYDMIGVTKDEFGIGEMSLINSDYRDFSDAEWEIVKRTHWDFYEHWINDIAHFRGMSIEQIDSLARGRVWTGSQARDRGLIDEVGGFNYALKSACELAGIEDPSRVVLVHLPTRLNLLQSIFSGGFFDNVTAYLVHMALYRCLFPRTGLFLWHRADMKTSGVY
ncbi:MAG: signal peptide peptidase SppA, partial [Candidatus Krumholzibacteria bacterium]|nr:signal peptide peptidase SppA [Candidatus Krumholzibacteria bacterium]